MCRAHAPGNSSAVRVKGAIPLYIATVKTLPRFALSLRTRATWEELMGRAPPAVVSCDASQAAGTGAERHRELITGALPFTDAVEVPQKLRLRSERVVASAVYVTHAPTSALDVSNLGE